MNLTFEQAARGCDKEIQVNVSDTCPRCQGEKAEPGTRKVTCTQCGGTGMVSVWNSPFRPSQNVLAVCVLTTTVSFPEIITGKQKFGWFSSSVRWWRLVTGWCHFDSFYLTVFSTGNLCSICWSYVVFNHHIAGWYHVVSIYHLNFRFKKCAVLLKCWQSLN
jgi:hypothetical protein